MADRVYKWTDDPMLGGVKDCDPDVVNECLMSLKYENTSDAIQNMYTTGQVEKQTRAFNQLQQMRHSSFDKSNFTVVGSPIITNDGVASGFSRQNYITTDNFNLYDATSFKLSFVYKLGTYRESCLMSYGTNSNSNIYLERIANNAVRWGIKKLDGTYAYVPFLSNIDIGTWYEYELELTSENILKARYRSLGTTVWTQETQIDCSSYRDSILNNQKFIIGVGFTTLVDTTGSIDLKHFSITVDGTEVFSGNKTGLNVIKEDNYTVVGSPVITDDGVASGFSAGHILLPHNFNISNEVIFKLKVSSGTGAPFLGFIDNSGTSLFYLNKTNDTSLQIVIRDSSFTPLYSKVFTVINDDLDIIIKVSNNNLNISINNTTTVNTSIDLTSFLAVLNNLYSLILGRNQSGVNAFTGSIDLNAFKIYVDGNLVYQPCLKIPYTESKTGSKIVDEVYRDRVIDLYEQEGQAGYYTIDETNQNFTLPMGEIYGMIEQKGTYHPPLLSTMWSDHLLNDMSWLRADTFSWQSGTTYSLVYNELLSEYNNSASTTKTEGSITFKHTPKGYKIALANQESAVLNKYNSDGIAWYYILDTTNKKFKLPRAKHPSLVTLTNPTPVIGNGKSLGLTNGTINVGLMGHTDSLPRQSAQLFNVNVGTAGSTITGLNNQAIGVVTDGSTSGLVANLSNNVKEYNMYLYFYVGTFTKSAEAQTAGLKAELLNGKADVATPSIQAPYIKDTYKNGTSGYNIWSNGYCEQWGVTTQLNTTVTFLKIFADTNYIGNCTPRGINGAGIAEGNPRFGAISTTQCFVSSGTSSLGANWKACGYLAEGEY